MLTNIGQILTDQHAQALASSQMTTDALALSEEQRATEVAAHHETLHALEAAEQHSASLTVEQLEMEGTIRSLHESLESAKEYGVIQHSSLRVEKRKIHRLRRKTDAQQQQVTKLRDVALPAAQNEARQAQSRLLSSLVNNEAFYMDSQSRIVRIQCEADESEALLKNACRRIKILRTQCTCTKLAGTWGIISAQEKMRRQSHTYKLMH